MANEILGKKRPAEGDPDGAQPLTKRFGCLQIGKPLFRSVVRSLVALTHSLIRAGTRIQGFGARAIHEPDENPRPPTLPADAMMLDDTEHTTYVHNLDQELVDPEPAKDHIFLHPIAERLLTVPETVLSNPAHGKELVLYTEPTSLTVPREQDSVRRAIIESRARARAEKTPSSSPSSQVSFPIKRETTLEGVYDDDPMDIDLDL